MLWFLLRMLVSQINRQCADAVVLTADPAKKGCCTWTEEERTLLSCVNTTADHGSIKFIFVETFGLVVPKSWGHRSSYHFKTQTFFCEQVYWTVSVMFVLLYLYKKHQIKYIFVDCFVVMVFVQYLTSCRICFSPSRAHMREKPAGGSHVLHIACGSACGAKRGQTLRRLGRRLRSECQLRTCTVAVNLQRQQRVDTRVGGIWEDVTPIIYILLGSPSKIR